MVYVKKLESTQFSTENNRVTEVGNLVRAEAVKSMARSERVKNLSRTYATGFLSDLPMFHLCI